MSTLNESIVEDAALEWFGEQCRVAPTLTRPLPRGEEEEREAIRRLNRAILEEARAVVADSAAAQTERRLIP